MHKQTLILLFVGFIQHSFAQTPFAEFNLKSNKIDDIQAFELGDSVFFTYTDKLNAERVKKAFWLNSSGRPTELSLNRLLGNALVGVTSNQGKIYYYYLEKVESVLMIKMLEQVGTTVNPVAATTVIGGEVISVHTEENQLSIITYNKDGNKLNIMRLIGNQIKGEMNFLLPLNLSRFLKNSSGLITGFEMPAVEQGSGKVKFYRKSDELVMTVDEPYRGERSKTTIVKMNLTTGLVTSTEILAPENQEFRSFYYLDKLFRIHRGNYRLILNVYDVNSGDSLYSKTIEKDKALLDQVVYLREGKRRKTGYSSMYHMFSKDIDLVILVQPGSSKGNERVVLGNFFNEKGTGSFAGFPDPFSLLVGFAVTHAIARLSESPGISKYFYLEGNIEKGFDFESPENNPKACVRQIIDEYEISRDNAEDVAERWYLYLLYKGYVELKDGALGIYQEKKKGNKTLILLKYNAK